MVLKTLNTNQKFKINSVEYLLVFLFAVLGGFQAGGLIPAKTYIGGIFCIHYLITKKRIEKKPLFCSIFSYIIIGIIHQYVYNYTSNRLLLELPLLILSGYYIINYLGWKFRYVLLHVMTVLAMISLFFYVAMFLFGYIPKTPFSTAMYPGNVFFYVVRFNEIDLLRNCGPYWEPGAFGGYIVMTLMLFFDSFKELYQKYRVHVVILFLALLTTKSTQAYFSAFLLIVFYFYKDKISIKNVIFFILFSIISFLIFTKLSFLQEKVKEQIELSFDWEDDRSLQTANRFTTTLLDFYYIEKHPFIGCTDDNNRRYSDHPFVLRVVKEYGAYGSGSGLTSNIAMYGLFPFLIWLLLSYKKIRYLYGTKSSIYLMIIFIALGQGEQYSNAIFYLSLPFLAELK